jgi:hypothetical protein
VYQALLVGLFVTFVLVVFQPFGSYNWSHPYKVLILAGYGAVAALTTFLNFYAFPRWLPVLFAEARWTVGKELLWNLLPVFLGGFLSTAYGSLVGAMPFSFPQVAYMTAVVFLVGLLPALLLVLFNYLYLLRKYQSPGPVAPAPPLAGEAAPTLVLVADNGKDKLVLPAADLLFLEASDNYCTVFYLAGETLTKTLLRSSLGRLESQVGLPRVIRCHRSYVVNLDRVRDVTGNAQGYQLHLAPPGLAVPVARAYAPAIRAHFPPANHPTGVNHSPRAFVNRPSSGRRIVRALTFGKSSQSAFP